jgi:arylsulfatase A-like enzyme
MALSRGSALRRVASKARFLLGAFLGLIPAFSAPASEPPPNFVVVLVDDLGVGDLGSYGQPMIQTPRLDAMASGGIRLTRLYAGDAWCPVTRVSLLTGRHAGHAVVRGDLVPPEDSDGEPLYLQRFLRLAGFATGMFGKWGLGSYDADDGGPAVAVGGRPSHLGFDEFLGAMTHRDAHTHELPPYPQQPGDAPIHDRLWEIDGGQTIESGLLDVPFIQEDVMVAALDFVTRHRDQPFFLYLPFNLPHAEYYIPPDDPAWLPYLDETGTSVFPETPFAGNALMRRPVPEPKAAYAALVGRIDADVGRLLDHLQTLGLAARTLVVFASDNGPAGDAPYNNPDFFGSAAGLRGLKLELFEGGIRVPGILYWPGRIAPGRLSAEPVGLWDLFPTLFELAGLEVPAGVDGVSLVPLIDGRRPTPHDEERPLYWETWNSVFRGQAIRDGSLKLVRTGTVDPSGPVALYDLAVDPTERMDLSRDRERCATLLQLIARLNAARSDPPGGGFSVTPLAPVCPLFRDGFETGDTSAWAQTSP